MRPGALAAVAVVSAVLGGTTALLVGKAAGWVDDDAPNRPVVAAPADGATVAATRVERDAAEPLVGNGFDPAQIYRKRAAGVVTIVALFEEHGTTGEAQGSGFVVSKDGYILTNSHVITTAGEGAPTEKPERAETVYVQYRDGERVPAKIVGWDVYDDVGLVKVDPAEHPVSPVPLGDSNRVVVGEPIAVIGSPFGNESSLSVGVVAATERSIGSLTSDYKLVDAIQTDAPINRGNSGGPMFDSEGDAIGISAQIRSESGTAEGVGFAIPINAAKRSMEELIANGRVSYAWLGVVAQTVTPRLARHFGFDASRGAAIQEVVSDSPAADAGLEGGRAEREFEGIPFRPGGDLVIALDGQPVRTADDVVRAINVRVPGQRVRLTVLRGSERLDVTVVLGERPANPPETGR